MVSVFSYLSSLSPFDETSPLLVLSVLLIVGAFGGMAAKRLHLPEITGYILAGLLLGPSGLNIFGAMDVAHVLQPLSTFAMGLIAVAIGGHLSYRRIHNALRRILSIAILESFGAATAVSLIAYWLGAGPAALLLGAIAMATSPATAIATVRETRAKGTFVKTLLAAIAVDNILCIVGFVFMSSLIAGYLSGPSLNVGAAVAAAVWALFGAACLGWLLGYGVEELMRRRRLRGFGVVFVSILLCAGLSPLFKLSPLLTCLFFGVRLGNGSENADEQLTALGPIEPLLYTCFFTLAGISLHLSEFRHVGLVWGGYVAARFAGKALGAMLGGMLGTGSARIWSNMPLALVPEAGVSIGLVVLLNGDPRMSAEIRELVTPLILASVTVNEIIGPLLTRIALKRSEERDMDRRRIMDFVQEEYIMVGLQAEDKWDAIRQLTDFFLRIHHMPMDARAHLYETIEEREREVSTGIGYETAIPHGRIETGSDIQGVLGIAPDGVDFDAPDGRPAKLILLIVTPAEHAKRHLEVLASLAGMVGNDAIRSRLIAAIDPNDAWETIVSKESRSYNYFQDGES